MHNYKLYTVIIHSHTQTSARTHERTRHTRARARERASEKEVTLCNKTVNAELDYLSVCRFRGTKHTPTRITATTTTAAAAAATTASTTTRPEVTQPFRPTVEFWYLNSSRMVQKKRYWTTWERSHWAIIRFSVLRSVERDGRGVDSFGGTCLLRHTRLTEWKAALKLKRRFKVFVCLYYVLSVVTSGAETNQVNVGWAFTALTVIHCFGGRSNYLTLVHIAHFFVLISFVVLFSFLVDWARSTN